MKSYYEENHKDYFESTIDIDPSSFLMPLTGLLKPGATVLDIGCGSGRDLAWLAERGFKPTGFEQSPCLAKRAEDHSKQTVIEGDFTNFDFSTLRFDALVLVGALVHLSKDELPVVLASVCRALIPNGLILLTLKEGIGTSKTIDGRVFTLWSPGELEEILSKNNLEVLDFSRQVSKLRRDDIWLGYVLKLDDD